MNIFNELPILKDGNYDLRFPLEAFNNHCVKLFNSREKINKILGGRNIYFSFLDTRKEKDIFIKRLDSLILMRDFILNYVKKEIPKSNIVSLYVYGSYLYGSDNFRPDDIDIVVIVDGSAFKYVIGQIIIPPSVRNYSKVGVNKLSLFFYGKDNMELGVPVNDTVIAGLMHKETIKREISVAYWRNIVIWGKDFEYIPNNKKNAMIVLARMINGCRERLLKIGKNAKENEDMTIRKVVNRLVEANIFLNFFNPEIYLNKNKLLNLPAKAARHNLSFQEIKKLYKSIVDLYGKICPKMIKE